MRHTKTPDRVNRRAVSTARRAVLALALATAAAVAAAGPLEVAIVDADGEPVGNAVVTLHSSSGLDTGPGVAQTHTIDQRDLQFDPQVQVFHPGDSVVFRNSDRTRHHVYSFAPGSAFETVVKPGESSAPMKLSFPGIVSVGCNIHDRMITYLVVTDAPFAAQSGADGLVRFADVPDGAWTVRVWQPRSKAENQTSEQAMAMPAASGSRMRFVLTLRPERRDDRESATY
jgi:plastocyanin